MSEASTLPIAVTAALESAVNAALALDPDTLEALGRLEGRIIGIELQGLGVTLHVVPGREGLALMGRFEGEPDATLSGPPLALVRAALSAQPSSRVMSGDISIRGDTELAQRFQSLLQNLDIDWEEHLSHLTGDLVAHQAGNIIQGLAQWTGRLGETLGMNLSEYLQEEQRTLPSRIETEQFLAAVDELRSDADRLEARMKRLRRKLDEKSGDDSPT